MEEKTIEANQNLYVIGEAYKVGDKIHIGNPQDNKKPFIISTKTEDDIVNESNKHGKFLFIGGIIAIVAGLGFIITNLIK